MFARLGYAAKKGWRRRRTNRVGITAECEATLMCTRTPFNLVCLGIALCLPAPVVAQAIAVLSPSQQTVQDAPTVTPEMTKRLDGRLFYSAQERQRLDNARKRGSLVGETGSPYEVPPSVLNGFIKRSDGKTAVWVDGEVRWDALGKNTAALVPTIVGGPATYLESTGRETLAASPKPNVLAKKAVKARVRKNTVPRMMQ